MAAIFPLHSHSVWHLSIAAVVTIAAIAIPLFLVFEDYFSSRLVLVDLLLTLVYGIDFVVLLRTRGSKPGVSLFWDIVALLPLWVMTGVVWVLLFRLAKLARIVGLMQSLRRDMALSWGLLRLSFFAYWFLLSIHWLSCGWLALHGHAGREYHASEYLQSVYWCVQTLSSVGYGDVLPQTDAEYVYAIAVMIFGVAVFGYVAGTVVSILANIDPAKGHHQETMEKVAAFMKYRGLPQHLQRRIRDYFQYLWEQRRGYGESAVLASLPPSLLNEVSLYLKKDIIEKAPFFRNAPDQLVREIAMQMKPVTYMPGDFVCKAGDYAHEMYFISRGKLEVISADSKTVLTTLGEGDFFGEIALIQNRPRTASVRALEYCDLYTLDKSALEHVLEADTSFAAQVESSIKARLERGV